MERNNQINSTERQLINRVLNGDNQALSLATSILQTNTRNARPATIKWFSLLAGTGIGLAIVHYTQPLGIHSLAIMAFSIAVSFLGYFYYLKQSGN